MSARAAAASEPEVVQAAESLLTNGNALDAVLAGVLAACAMDSSVLLGPVQLLVGGAGAGLRAIDGRVRQPGRGAPRPRGFKEEDAIPDAARVGVPALLAALAGAHATFGSATLAAILAPALALAEIHSPRRAVLARIAEVGARALATGTIAEELVASCGRVHGGLLTREDLEELRPIVVACDTRAAGARQVAFAPWSRDEERASVDALDGSRVRAVAAVDHRGVIALACYETSDDGLAIESLGLVAPRAAMPVLRGQTRVSPGAPRPTACPLALASNEGVADVALAVTAAGDAEQKLAELIADLDARLVSDAPLAPGARVIGVARSKAGARALRAS